MAVALEDMERASYESIPAGLWIGATITTVLTGLVALLWYAQHGLALRKFEDRVEQEKRERLRANRDQQVEPGDLAALLAANRALLDEYQRPVRSQARTSYVYSQVAILAGLILLLIGGLLIVVGNDNTTRIAVAALASVGSAVSGYVARTYLRIYERAQAQLNFYFREPLVTSYLLTAERLASKLEGDRQEEAYSAMVEQIVQIAKSDVDQASQ